MRVPTIWTPIHVRSLINPRALNAFRLAEYRIRHGRVKGSGTWTDERRLEHCLVAAFKAAMEVETYGTKTEETGKITRRRKAVPPGKVDRGN